MSPAPLAGMLEALEAPRGALVVMDRGVATEDRIGWLREEGYRYVVASRQGSRQFDPELALTLETASKGLQFHKEVSEDGGEVRLYCRSEERAHKERGIVERFSRRFEQGLTRLSEGLSRPAGSQGHREGPGTDRAAEGAEPRGGSTLHHRGPHRRQRPQGDGPDLEAPAPPGLDGTFSPCLGRLSV